MTRTFDYHFSLRKHKNHKEGPVKVYLRITVDGQRTETATSVSVDPNEWDNKLGRMKGRTEKSRSLNSYLDILQSKLYDSHAELLRANVPITAEMLRNQFNGKNDRARNLVEIFEAYHSNMEKFIGKDYVAFTVRKFHTTFLHVSNFIKWKYQLVISVYPRLNMNSQLTLNFI